MRRLAEALWRERVCLNMEIALLQAVAEGEACAMSGGDGLPSLNTLMRYRSRIDSNRRQALDELENLRASAASEPGPKQAPRRFEPCTNEPGPVEP